MNSKEMLKTFDDTFMGVLDTECEHGINPASECPNRRCEERMRWAIRAWLIPSLDSLTNEVRREERQETHAELVEQIKVAIYAQETGINGKARINGLDKWLDGPIVSTKYEQDKLEGQKVLLRFIEKGYFPALTPKK